MSSEKAKKNHPFASYLTPDEDVLWMSSRVGQLALQRREVIYALLGTLGLFVVTVLMFARRATTTDNGLPFLIHLAYEISPCCALLAMVFLPTLWLLNEKWPTDYDYAVTDKRLLYRYKDQVQTIRLEKLPPISLFPTGGTHGTLRFGEAFPGWYDLENATEIQRLIEEARQKRIDEIS
jgi:hypothetical protein